VRIKSTNDLMIMNMWMIELHDRKQSQTHFQRSSERRLRVGDVAVSLASRLVNFVKEACAATNMAFKNDPSTWSVTRDDELRMTTAYFGDCKSAQRRKTRPSCALTCKSRLHRARAQLGCFRSRSLLLRPAPQDTLLDDALRMPLNMTRFAHILRLAITFNDGAFAHPIATRTLREFFVDQPVRMRPRFCGRSTRC
jgi:hypothetical protein